MVEVPLSRGYAALVDDEDAERVLAYRWHAHFATCGAVYARSKKAGYLHRFIMEPGVGFEVDHRSGDGLDNRRRNLRVLTHAQNQQNRHRQHGRTSRYRGVSWWKTRQQWSVRVKVEGVTHFGGYFVDEDEAGRAALALRQRLMAYSTT